MGNVWGRCSSSSCRFWEVEASVAAVSEEPMAIKNNVTTLQSGPPPHVSCARIVGSKADSSPANGRGTEASEETWLLAAPRSCYGYRRAASFLHDKLLCPSSGSSSARPQRTEESVA